MTDAEMEAHLRREDILHAAMIRAALVASRGLPPSVGCRFAIKHSPAPVREIDAADSEGGHPD